MLDFAVQKFLKLHLIDVAVESLHPEALFFFPASILTLSQNSLLYFNFSLRNEEVSLLLLRDLFSDDGPSFNTWCDSSRFFIVIPCISRAFGLSASARDFSVQLFALFLLHLLCSGQLNLAIEYHI